MLTQGSKTQRDHLEETTQALEELKEVGMEISLFL